MIKLNLQNAVTEEALEKYQPIVKRLATKMERLESEGFEFLGWKDIPARNNNEVVSKIKREANRLKKERIQVLVVIGIGGSFAGAKAAIEMVQGKYPTKKDMEVVFVGESLSATNIAQKLAYVQDKNFAINVISKSGSTTESAIAFRIFRKLLQEKVGINNAKKFIIATTDANNGALLKMANENGFTKFVIPDNVGGRFSVLTAVGLFPMACAGLDIDKVMRGALVAHKRYSPDTILNNEAYRYAAARHILMSKFPVELMVQYEPQMDAFNEWWKQLAGESEGKNHKGLFPASAIFSTDLHSLGQFIQEGSRVLFETVITVDMPNVDVAILENERNLDNLNYLTSLTVSEVNQIAFEATTEAHVKVGKVPNIHLSIPKMNEDNFGKLVIFFQRAVTLTAYLMGVNPFNQPGVEVYKQNMFRRLGKPE